MAEYLLIVERNRRQLRDYLARQFSEGNKVEVFLDRRSRERRHAVTTMESERRRADRRRQAPRRSDWFVMVRRQTT